MEPIQPETIDDETLRAYLAEQLSPRVMTLIEKALRDSASLRDRLEEIRLGRADDHLHSLGAIWQRNRLTCPDRQQLGSFLMDAIDEGLARYIRFHIEVVECPFCQANLDDLRQQAIAAAAAAPTRAFRSRIFQSSRGLLSTDE